MELTSRLKDSDDAIDGLRDIAEAAGKEEGAVYSLNSGYSVSICPLAMLLEFA